MSDKKEVAEAKPAATVLLLRDDDKDGLEVLMVERHHQIDFATGALVFPGGKVMDSDGLGDHIAAARAVSDGHEGLDDLEVAFRVAAVREAFEESGILLARRKGESDFIAAADLDAYDDERFRLNDRNDDRSIVDIAKEHDLTLALDAMTPFAHWITPDFMPKRFDTKFYLCTVPSSQDAAHDGEEMVDTVWITPKNALKAADDGSRTIIFPTRMNVQKLAESNSVAEAVGKDPTGTVYPFIQEVDGAPRLFIQPDAGYGEISIAMNEI